VKKHRYRKKEHEDISAFQVFAGQRIRRECGYDKVHQCAAGRVQNGVSISTQDVPI
jgi:hypothetical protein